MRITRQLFILFAFCLIGLCSAGMFWYWQAQVMEDPIKSVPLYHNATNVINTKMEKVWITGSHYENFETHYVAQASETDINDFYNDRLLEKGWQRTGVPGQNFISGDPLGYTQLRKVPTAIKFTGFSGPFFGVPWFHVSFDYVFCNLLIHINSSDYPPPGGISEVPPGSIRVVLAYGISRESVP